ncbi:MAG: hypothetical protein QOG01_1304 [Pseudonocardiales bacterium]|nr:hypothetical protein [Pseudonocardiales bacterium]
MTTGFQVAFDAADAQRLGRFWGQAPSVARTRRTASTGFVLHDIEFCVQ